MMTQYPEELIQVMLRNSLKSALALAMVLDGVLYGICSTFQPFPYFADVV
jgi:hypothetical protein